MKIYYDFHIHSALSPCAENDMTTYNIVNMAKIKGLDAIAVTDHNSVKNIKATIIAGSKIGITVIPGIEVETAEEVHVLTLFPSLEKAYSAWRIIDENLPLIENNSEIFGKQLIMDENDNITGEETKLLLNTATLTVNEVSSLAQSAGGIAIPAHVNRKSNSIISNLGFVPPELEATAIEIVKTPLSHPYTDYLHPGDYDILYNSDAHRLGDISERVNFIEVFNNKPQNIINFFG